MTSRLVDSKDMALTLNDDCVWFDREIKLAKISERTINARQDRNVVVLSHFEKTRSEIASSLRALSVQFAPFVDAAVLCEPGTGKVWLGLANAFQSPGLVVNRDAGVAVEMIVAEHHPLYSKDRELIEAAEKLQCAVELTFYFSLDDPLVQRFGGISLQELMTRLGMNKDESIEHTLVSRAIRRAQEKIEEESFKDFPTQSIEDWFRYNG